MFRTKISSLIWRGAAAASVMALPAIALAQEATAVQGVATSFVKIANTLVTIVFILAVLVFGWGVVKYITSAGDPEGEKAARGFLWWGVIGMAVLALVFGIIRYGATFFGVSTTEKGEISIPKIEGKARAQ